MNCSMKPSTFRLVILIAAFSLLAGGVGYSFGKRDVQFAWENYEPTVTVSNTNVPSEKDIDFELFWQVWDLLENNYFDKTKLDSQKMVWGAIRGMTQSIGDPYTVFLPPEENDKTRDDLNGTFEGIGAQLGMKEDRIVVIAPLKGMPAEKAGLKAGDFVVKVNDQDTFGWSVPEAVEKIRGPKGEPVRLTILHEGDKQMTEISVIRGTIEVPVVEVSFESDVAIIKLNQFVDTMPGQWDSAINNVVTTCAAKGAAGCRGVVLDLRNNPGGFLQGSVYVASEFMNNGTVVIETHANGTETTLEVNRPGKLTSLPMVVLINGGSASASEIVTGALKVSGRAKIVGETSFGKGTIQERKELPQDAGLHITTARWLLPDKSWIHEVGIKPDIEVTDNPDTLTVDEQLQTAVSTLQ